MGSFVLLFLTICLHVVGCYDGICIHERSLQVHHIPDSSPYPPSPHGEGREKSWLPRQTLYHPKLYELLGLPSNFGLYDEEVITDDGETRSRHASFSPKPHGYCPFYPEISYHKSSYGLGYGYTFVQLDRARCARELCPTGFSPIIPHYARIAAASMLSVHLRPAVCGDGLIQSAPAVGPFSSSFVETCEFEQPHGCSSLLAPPRAYHCPYRKTEKESLRSCFKRCRWGPLTEGGCRPGYESRSSFLHYCGNGLLEIDQADSLDEEHVHRLSLVDNVHVQAHALICGYEDEYMTVPIYCDPALNPLWNPVGRTYFILDQQQKDSPLKEGLPQKGSHTRYASPSSQEQCDLGDELNGLPSAGCTSDCRLKCIHGRPDYSTFPRLTCHQPCDEQGWTGPYCDIPRCQNGVAADDGRCVSCREGFSGAYCDIYDAISCEHGRLLFGGQPSSSPYCKCDPGWHGQSCSVTTCLRRSKDECTECLPGWQSPSDHCSVPECVFGVPRSVSAQKVPSGDSLMSGYCGDGSCDSPYLWGPSCNETGCASLALTHPNGTVIMAVDSSTMPATRPPVLNTNNTDKYFFVCSGCSAGWAGPFCNISTILCDTANGDIDLDSPEGFCKQPCKNAYFYGRKCALSNAIFRQDVYVEWSPLPGWLRIEKIHTGPHVKKAGQASFVRCKPGWSGAYCTGVRCSINRGLLDVSSLALKCLPGSCAPGWTGPYCDISICQAWRDNGTKEAVYSVWKNHLYQNYPSFMSWLSKTLYMIESQRLFITNGSPILSVRNTFDKRESSFFPSLTLFSPSSWWPSSFKSFNNESPSVMPPSINAIRASWRDDFLDPFGLVVPESVYPTPKLPLPDVADAMKKHISTPLCSSCRRNVETLISNNNEHEEYYCPIVKCKHGVREKGSLSDAPCIHCHPGWHGPYCDETGCTDPPECTVCKPGYWGTYCTLYRAPSECSPEHGVVNRHTGDCICKGDGWGGLGCNAPSCQHGLLDQKSGHCVAGSCKKDWLGPDCHEPRCIYGYRLYPALPSENPAQRGTMATDQTRGQWFIRHQRTFGPVGVLKNDQDSDFLAIPVHLEDGNGRPSCAIKRDDGKCSACLPGIPDSPYCDTDIDGLCVHGLWSFVGGTCGPCFAGYSGPACNETKCLVWSVPYERCSRCRLGTVGDDNDGLDDIPKDIVLSLAPPQDMFRKSRKMGVSGKGSESRYPYGASYGPLCQYTSQCLFGILDDRSFDGACRPDVPCLDIRYVGRFCNETRCRDDQCERCLPGWKGPDCRFPDTLPMPVRSWWSLDGCVHTDIPSIDILFSSLFFSGDPPSNISPLRMCQPGWTGRDCRALACQHGIVDLTDGTLRCYRGSCFPGWAGPYCGIPLCSATNATYMRSFVSKSLEPWIVSNGLFIEWISATFKEASSPEAVFIPMEQTKTRTSFFSLFRTSSDSKPPKSVRMHIKKKRTKGPPVPVAYPPGISVPAENGADAKFFSYSSYIDENGHGPCLSCRHASMAGPFCNKSICAPYGWQAAHHRGIDGGCLGCRLGFSGPVCRDTFCKNSSVAPTAELSGSLQELFPTIETLISSLIDYMTSIKDHRPAIYGDLMSVIENKKYIPREYPSWFWSASPSKETLVRNEFVQKIKSLAPLASPSIETIQEKAWLMDKQGTVPPQGSLLIHALLGDPFCLKGDGSHCLTLVRGVLSRWGKNSTEGPFSDDDSMCSQCEQGHFGPGCLLKSCCDCRYGDVPLNSPQCTQPCRDLRMTGPFCNISRCSTHGLMGAMLGRGCGGCKEGWEGVYCEIPRCRHGIRVLKTTKKDLYKVEEKIFASPRYYESTMNKNGKEKIHLTLLSSPRAASFKERQDVPGETYFVNTRLMREQDIKEKYNLASMKSVHIIKDDDDADDGGSSVFGGRCSFCRAGWTYSPSSPYCAGVAYLEGSDKNDEWPCAHGYCDRSSGRCLFCRPGYYGLDCTTTKCLRWNKQYVECGECMSGWYGPLCQYKNLCVNGVIDEGSSSGMCSADLKCVPSLYSGPYCNETRCKEKAGWNGLYAGIKECPEGCKDGWAGPTCSTPVCKHGVSDPRSGHCIPGTCRPGWGGSKCDNLQCIHGNLVELPGDQEPILFRLPLWMCSREEADRQTHGRASMLKKEAYAVTVRANFTCACPFGWKGFLCHIPDCGHGIPDYEHGGCKECYDGYYGWTCFESVCPHGIPNPKYDTSSEKKDTRGHMFGAINREILGLFGGEGPCLACLGDWSGPNCNTAECDPKTQMDPVTFKCQSCPDGKYGPKCALESRCINGILDKESSDGSCLPDSCRVGQGRFCDEPTCLHGVPDPVTLECAYCLEEWTSKDGGKGNTCNRPLCKHGRLTMTSEHTYTCTCAFGWASKYCNVILPWRTSCPSPSVCPVQRGCPPCNITRTIIEGPCMWPDETIFDEAFPANDTKRKGSGPENSPLPQNQSFYEHTWEDIFGDGLLDINFARGDSNISRPVPPDHHLVDGYFWLSIALILLMVVLAFIVIKMLRVYLGFVLFRSWRLLFGVVRYIYSSIVTSRRQASDGQTCRQTMQEEEAAYQQHMA